MHVEEDRFKAPDGLELYERRWMPVDEPAAAVVLVHGINEHCGRYDWVAGELGRHGYAVSAMDLRGHGRSEGDRAYVRAFDEYLADLDVLVERARQRYAGKPLFLFGHSMGGTIALLFAITRQPEFQGLVVSAPAVEIGARVFPVLRRLAAVVSYLFPRLRLVSLGGRFISRDPEVVARFQDDPLVFHGGLPTRTGAEILRAAERIQRQMEAVRLPLLVLHGTGDIVADVEGSRRLCARAGSPDKTLRLYEGLYHEVLSEPEREEVAADLIRWLDARKT